MKIPIKNSDREANTMKKFFTLLLIIIITMTVPACRKDITHPNGKNENPILENSKEPSVETQEPEQQENQKNDEGQENKIVLENQAFKIYQPSPNEDIEGSTLVVKGLARVFEATIQYEFEDGHFIFDKGHTMASEGAPEWGEFEINIAIDEKASGQARVILYEESMKDGSRLHELQIPVNIISKE